MIRIKSYALVNIVAGREIMPEYYQSKAKAALLAKEALSILRDGRLEPMRAELGEVRRRLGGPGASNRAAREVLLVAAAARPRV